ncbi:MAG: ABC transporter permease [Acidobacteriaceae bacterium]
MSLRRYLRRRIWDEERARELEAHLAQETDDNVARGMTREEARRRAYMKLGNPTVIREEIWKMNSFVSVEDLGRDIRYAFRQLKHSPGFAAIAMVTLALGIGVNTAIFSVANGLLFSSFHIRNQSNVVELGFRQKGADWQPNLSLPEYQEIGREGKAGFSETVGYEWGLDGLSMEGSKPDRVFTSYVTGNYFEMLGVEPLMGRFFHAGEGETPGADPVMVLSYAYWTQHFGADRNIVGRQVLVDNHPITVVGVGPRDFRGMNPALSPQAYFPLAMVVPLEAQSEADFHKQSNRSLWVYGRLQPGVTRQQADATLGVIAHRFVLADPGTEKDAEVKTFAPTAGRNGFDPEAHLGTIAMLFLALAGLVLLLASVNVANLLLVRATVREREMVIRSALGAQRFRLIRQMMTESFVLAMLGGAAGIGLGTWGSHLLGTVSLNTDLPIRFDFPNDWHVFAFSAVVALAAGALVGIVPAVRLARANLNLVLREGGRGVAGGGHKFRDALVIVQVGSALTLLIVAGLFIRSLQQSEHTDLGFNATNVLTMMMDPAELGYSDPKSRDFFRDLIERVRALPGVQLATTAQSMPMGLLGNGGDTVVVNGYQPPVGQTSASVSYNVVGTDYFQTLEIPLREGRDFNAGDDEKHPYAAIVSEAMAKKYWAHEDAIGRKFTMGSDPSHPIEVVGVAADARYSGFRGPIAPYFYVPFEQHYVQNTLQTLEVKAAGNPAGMIAEVEGAIRGMTPGLPVFQVKMLHEALYSLNGLLIYQIAAALAGVLGTLGLVLAVVGVYGVLSYVVSQRTSEIGVRMALGAGRGDILRIVYKQGLWIVGIGLAVGLGASFGVAHLLRSMIVVSPGDPMTYLGVSALLAGIAMLACYIPARRAMRVEPMQALRME